MNRYLILVLLPLCCLLFNCKRPQTKSKKPEAIIHPLELKSFNDTIIDNFIRDNQEYSVYIKSSKEFYKKRNYEYAWFTKEGISPRSDMFVNMVKAAENKIALDHDSIINTYQNIRKDTSVQSAQDSLLKLELNLTLTFFSFADKEWSGNDQKMVRQLEWYIPKKKLKYEDILDSLLKKEDTLFSSPVYGQYDLLKSYLAKYRKIEEQGEWPFITPDAKVYKLGDSSTVVALIKKRLHVTGDLSITDTTLVFNETTEKGVKAFQRRYGMIEDGKVGSGVIKEMNVPIHKRIEQIIINMERCRWIPYDYKGTNFMVNIPEYKLYAKDGKDYLWDMNVVVGKITHKTVIFNGNLQYVVFNPYWNVPFNIFSKEMLPHLRKNPSWLNSQHMEVIKTSEPNTIIDSKSINWFHTPNYYRVYTIRQKPGPNNALGTVKFLFPNEYNIYLHDTPSKDLFALPNRSFSHGCIRVGEPGKLAQFLLKDEQGWSDKAITKTISAEKEHYISLKKSVPVLIAYFTSWVDKDGKINFRNDIYGHDAKMARTIIEKPRI